MRTLARDSANFIHPAFDGCKSSKFMLIPLRTTAHPSGLSHGTGEISSGTQLQSTNAFFAVAILIDAAALRQRANALFKSNSDVYIERRAVC